MCFHNSLSKKALEVAQRYNIKVIPELQFNPIFHSSGFVYPNWLTITNFNNDSIELMSWGLIPKWAQSREKANEIKSMTLNAMSETAFEKPSFKDSFKTNRCLIPSTGFFEWKEVGGKKYPYFIYDKSSEIFSMAGIWQEWVDKITGEIFKTFSILTKPANKLMAEIHNTKKRMPVILPIEVEKTWINSNLNVEQMKEILNENYTLNLEARTISKTITAKGINTNVPEISNPFYYQELNTLF